MTIDLSILPEPQVIEQIGFDALFQRKLDTLIALDDGFTALLESDPAITLLEDGAYSEMLVRARINQAAQARLLAKATGSDLDQLAVFYDVMRLDGEDDDRLRDRVVTAIKGRSTAGTVAGYRYAALSVSTDIQDISIDSPEGGIVRVSVLSKLLDGEPSPELLQAVQDRLSADDVRPICHTVQVVPVEVIPVDVSAEIYLLPNTPQSTFDELGSRFRATAQNEKALGFDLTPSWVVSRLHVVGVQRVILRAPLDVVVCQPNQCFAIRELNLILNGRDY